MSIDVIVETAGGLEPNQRDDAETWKNAAPEVRISAMEAEKPYSEADLALFHELTGYRLAMLDTMWIVVDDDGKRAAFADRLFTALVEEAFRFADRRRRAGEAPRHDLTMEDLATALDPLQRVTSQIGWRGINAFRRFEALLSTHGQPAIATPLEASAAIPAI
ncbi:hypothetical protein KX729_06865 [Rhizobium sp. XQZ8]|uniref:hypothetical protein n=1 Tax=Rhizobium populisoli TaxID=2859785 RepID=UPI001CA4C652|nr:hypothetical protein [Rhizobium populisoli]MBW6421159.1 hypothetical protein [Rhizobium populisoli]